MAGKGAGGRAARGVRLTVNGEPVTVSGSPERHLLEALRVDLGRTGTKYGCGEGECGACTVLVDGTPTPACQVPIRELQGADVRTIEGMATGDRLNPAQQAFVETGAFQCGFCTPGMVVRATALLDRNPDPSEADIREALEPHLCRCGANARIVRAVRRASEIARGDRMRGP